jgi:hypothetical protein
LLRKGVEIFEDCLGFDSPDTAEAYTKLALCYQEYGLNVFCASNYFVRHWLRHGFGEDFAHSSKL